MVDKSSLKIIYCSKCNDSSSQQERKVISISFIKNLVYWNYLYIQINYVYWLICVLESKNLKKLNKIVCNLSEKQHESSKEMLQKEDLLGGSEGNDHVHEVFFSLFIKK